MRESKGGGEEGVAGVDTDLHGVLGVDQLQQHVQELTFICWCSHDVPENSAFIINTKQQDKSELSWSFDDI